MQDSEKWDLGSSKVFSNKTGVCSDSNPATVPTSNNRRVMTIEENLRPTRKLKDGSIGEMLPSANMSGAGQLKEAITNMNKS